MLHSTDTQHYMNILGLPRRNSSWLFRILELFIECVDLGSSATQLKWLIELINDMPSVAPAHKCHIAVTSPSSLLNYASGTFSNQDRAVAVIHTKLYVRKEFMWQYSATF